MKPAASDQLMHSWTPQQLLAVYDFCKLMAEHIWQEHEQVLINQMIQADQQHEPKRCSHTTDVNLELPFDDTDLT